MMASLLTCLRMFHNNSFGTSENQALVPAMARSSRSRLSMAATSRSCRARRCAALPSSIAITPRSCCLLPRGPYTIAASCASSASSISAAGCCFGCCFGWGFAGAAEGLGGLGGAAGGLVGLGGAAEGFGGASGDGRARWLRLGGGGGGPRPGPGAGAGLLEGGGAGPRTSTPAPLRRSLRPTRNEGTAADSMTRSPFLVTMESLPSSTNLACTTWMSNGRSLISKPTTAISIERPPPLI
mmetsp:Transcript_8088/g.22989  ORF Transcript_8088/g.22989 Transcript_8088/m.22989 type:complete len:240 (-) Transcript_8088:241-960(-)